MKTATKEKSQPRHLAAMTERAARIQGLILDQFEDRIQEAGAALDNGFDLVARFNRMTLTFDLKRKEKLETSFLPARAALRDAGVSLHLMTLGYLPASMTLLRQSAESLCLAYLVKREPTLLLMGRPVALGAASRALHRRHDLGNEQATCDRLFTLIDRLEKAVTGDHKPVALGAQFDRSVIPGYYAHVENIKLLANQISEFLKEVLLVEAHK